MNFIIIDINMNINHNCHHKLYLLYKENIMSCYLP